LIPEEVAGASLVFLRDVLPKLVSWDTAYVTGGKAIVVLLQSTSGVSTINPLIAFYDIHGGKSEMLFFYFVPDTRDEIDLIINIILYEIISNTVELTISQN
jgi:hypothetical protein